ncbi:dipeptidyl-peptidase 3 family protein [Pseudidiomarina taiwanensis]|uniref:Zn-dependent hydrolase n=1 Tax=Pseudidiomarina taiwanensis TaxID=337250 RepID=A0A432ZCL7_9GAMM|nr:Zn-dependent hydrolase [Pseudidiomarina taiwanensis]RUO75664.1 Zn-dependent hydrolase [Pseudidiomarina taiwanensis]
MFKLPTSQFKQLTTGAVAAAIMLSLTACSPAPEATQPEPLQLVEGAEARLDIYQPVELSADLSALSENQRQLLSHLIDAAEIMDKLFWQQAFGAHADDFLQRISDPKVRAFAAINYGPWDRLNNDTPFLQGFDAKPAGANFYPADMTKAEFEQADFPGKVDLYSLVRRDQNGDLVSLPYNQVYATELEAAAKLLRKAATLAEDKDFARYLEMRADAFLSNDYQASDYAWMDMKDNLIDVIIGPIETYEDQLYGYRAGFEAYVLLKDMAWSERLAKYAEYLPELQRGLPVAPEYKAEMPGSEAQLNAYDVLYYAGHSNAGSKTIAVNLPNDEQVQLEKGTRRSQLKNAMRAKFDEILVPLADILIVPEQRKHITFDAFFANTMFHEVAHGLGIKNLVSGDGTVREALKEHASPLEEGKADILGLYMVTQLLEQGVLDEGQLEDYYTTFLAGIFRSVRFGASSAHGKANMIRFNYFEQAGAFTRNEQGQYAVNMDAMRTAMNSLSEKILTLQGDGDYLGVTELFEEMGNVSPQLQADLDRLGAADIPVDITFIQGKQVLGLSH